MVINGAAQTCNVARQPNPFQTNAQTRLAMQKYAAEQGVSEQEALKKGMEEKSHELTEKGSALCTKV